MGYVSIEKILIKERGWRGIKWVSLKYLIFNLYIKPLIGRLVQIITD